MSLALTWPLLCQAVAPPVLLTATGVIWLIWGSRFKAIAASLLSLGLAIFALMLLIVAGYRWPSVQMLTESALCLVGMPLLVYGGTFAVLSRHGEIRVARGFLFGLLGLVPGYFIGEFVLISTACGMHSGGC